MNARVLACDHILGIGSPLRLFTVSCSYTMAIFYFFASFWHLLPVSRKKGPLSITDLFNNCHFCLTIARKKKAKKLDPVM